MQNCRFAVLSVILLMLYALVDFFKNALESMLRVKLLVSSVSFSSKDWIVDSERCQIILLMLAIVCILVFVIETIIKLLSGYRKRKL